MGQHYNSLPPKDLNSIESCHPNPPLDQPQGGAVPTSRIADPTYRTFLVAYVQCPPAAAPSWARPHHGRAGRCRGPERPYDGGIGGGPGHDPNLHHHPGLGLQVEVNPICVDSIKPGPSIVSPEARRSTPSQHRYDIRTEMVPILYETFLKLKAGLDFALCLTILAGASVGWMGRSIE